MVMLSNFVDKEKIHSCQTQILVFVYFSLYIYFELHLKLNIN